MSKPNLSNTRGESRSIQVRISERDDFTIRRAAMVRGETLSDFVRRAALRRAQTPVRSAGGAIEREMELHNQLLNKGDSNEDNASSIE